MERLRGVLPAPLPHSRGATTPLRSPGAPARPEQVAEELRHLPGFAWLDGGGERDHRFFVQPLAVLTARKGRAAVVGPAGRITFSAGGFGLLEAAFAAWGGPAKAFLTGYLGYELCAELERFAPVSPADLEDDLKTPDLHLALYVSCLRWDGRSWTLESTDAWPGMGDPVREAERVLAAARRREIPAPPESRLTSGPVVSRPSRPGFEAGVERIVERIRTGEVYQVNLCRRLEAPLSPEDVWPLYQRLRAASPATHGAFLDLGRSDSHRALLSVSPELFLSVRDGVVETRPIKGTRPRGATPREDRALARELQESVKDQAELTMIVDVARNDLGRVCETGTVEVVRHAELVTLPTLHHTVSTIRGKLRADESLVALLRAAFPPASITGAPKIQAIVVAAAEEERRRGPAMGAVGWLSLGGDLELSVAIRTAVAARGRVTYHAGCGIVVDSDPELEFAESTVKARAFLSALGVPEVT
ncbi:MAG TPA: anthranilate synthase component I family protein [Thermoanaerobaculia bacterium]